MFPSLTRALVRVFEATISALRVRNARFEWPNLAMPYCFSFATPRYCDAFFRNFILRYVHMSIDEGLQRERHCFCAFVTEINRSHRVNHLATSQNAQNCPPLRVCGCTPTEPNLTKITPPRSFLKTLSFYQFVHSDSFFCVHDATGKPLATWLRGYLNQPNTYLLPRL